MAGHICGGGRHLDEEEQGKGNKGRFHRLATLTRIYTDIGTRLGQPGGGT